MVERRERPNRPSLPRLALAIAAASIVPPLAGGCMEEGAEQTRTVAVAPLAATPAALPPRAERPRFLVHGTSGGIPKGVPNALLGAHLAINPCCHERPDFDGKPLKLLVRFVVDTHGKPGEVSIPDDAPWSILDCAERALELVRFPTLAKELSLNVPLVCQ